MRNLLIVGLVGALSLTGCWPGIVGPQAGPDRIELWTDQVASNATLTVEFLERENQVGQIGWHLEIDCPNAVELNETPDELQDRLDDRGYNVVVEGVECVRWNVNYQNGRDLCEGNDNTPYAPDLIADTQINWLGNTWNIDTWSDPGGEGCSAVACR